MFTKAIVLSFSVCILLWFAYRAFEDVKIFWRVTFNKTAVVLLKDGMNLENELVSVLGSTTCMAGETMCNISIEIKPDNVSNYCSFMYSTMMLNCSLSRWKNPSDPEELMCSLKMVTWPLPSSSANTCLFTGLYYLHCDWYNFGKEMSI